MKRALVILAAVLSLLFPIASIASGERYVAKAPDGSMIVTITDTPCVGAKILATLAKAGVPDEVVKTLHAAEVVFRGKHLEACYALDADGVNVVDEDGDNGSISAQFFKPEEVI